MKIIFILVIIFLSSFVTHAQTKPAAKPTPTPTNTQAAKSSPAYAEVLLQKTELVAELEDMLVRYTEEHPDVLETRFKLNSLQKDLDKMLAATDASKLTPALGRLILRKTELAADLWKLRQVYAEDHPDVKRAKRKVEAFEQAIKEILP